MIEVKNLVKLYGNHLAVDDLSLTLQPGKIYGLLGPNGAGKSTTMNIITGCLAATSGKVSINGYDIFDDPIEAKKCIGYLPEQPRLYPDMTPREYLSFIADARKLEKEEAKKNIDEIMVRTKIYDVQNKLIRHLSKGYQQRVGIASAMIGYPDIIILDEPTVGLDPIQIIEIRDLIRSLKEKHTVIFSSHIMQEVHAMCDYILIISHGKLVAEGTGEELAAMAEDMNKVSLTVKCNSYEFSNVMLGLNAKIESTEEKDGFTKATFTSPDDDIREKVFFAFADKKLPIIEMTAETMNLESIFVKLAGDSENAAAEEVSSEESANAVEENGEEAEQK